MPVALSAQAELKASQLTAINRQNCLQGFERSSHFPGRVDSSLNPLFGELDFEELGVRSAGPRPSPAPSFLSANPLYDEAANAPSAPAEPQRALPSYYVQDPAGLQTAQLSHLQVF